MSVGTEMYLSGSKSGSQRKLHLDTDCPHLKQASSHREAGPVEIEWYDVCRHCEVHHGE